MGEDEVAITRRFFKIMMPGFEERLILPPAFCRKTKEVKYLERAVLKSRKGRHVMQVSRNSNQVYLEGGWAQFVDEHGLSVGDVVVFEHTQDLQFYVAVFGSSACEELYLPINHHLAETSAQAVHRGRKKSAALGKSFTVSMTEYTVSRRARVTIPKELVRANDLEQKESASLRIGRERWEVKLWTAKALAFRVMMIAGWYQFCASNKLQVGDVCLFQLNPSSSSSPTTVSFDVHITRAASF